EPAGDVRPDARAMLPADRDADDQISHQVPYVVVHGVSVDVRHPAEVDFAADHTGAHPTSIRTPAPRLAAAAAAAIARQVVVEPEVHTGPGTDVPVGACLRRRPDARHR